jgi:chorismate mutase/prephenate dehydratase
LVSIIPSDSTSKAAELARNDSESACICSIVCAELFSLDILAKGVENQSNNTTRFLVIGKQEIKSKGNYDTMIIFVLEPQSVLNQVLELFLQQNITMIRLDTRPSKDMLWFFT